MWQNGGVPKIDAGTVKEHREAMTTKLVDAAERLLVDGGVDALTAGAVASSAGIARNSLYRYVDSVDDLRGKVVARYLPNWTSAVEDAVAAADDPLARLVAYVSANLAEASRSGHGWLMGMARGLTPAALAEIDGAHRSLGSMLVEQCRALDPSGLTMTTAIVQAILEAGFARLDAGDDLAVVTERCVGAVRALIASRTAA